MPGRGGPEPVSPPWSTFRGCGGSAPAECGAFRSLPAPSSRSLRAQGFVPALLAREILLRKAVVNGRAWLNFFVLCFCLAFSAFYELVEWWVALLSAEAAESFLGTQGYVWDTQSDMGWALIGALAALLLLPRWHDAQLRDLPR